MESLPSKTRRTRASVPHVKTGCFTCKFRRVKCDEGRPNCLRCQTFGVACDGYSYPSHMVVSKGQKPPSLKPRPKDTIANAIQTTMFENSVEKNCFEFWQWRRLAKAYAVFDSSAWIPLIFQSSHIASIRYCIVSLGALELARDHEHAERALSSTVRPRGETANVHHRTAIKYFDKAVRQMRADTVAKSQTLRTTIITCLLIHWFESFNGNYSVAVAQIRAGDELVSEWRSGNSATRTVVEDELVQAIGNLTLQIFSVPDRRPQARRMALKQENWESLRSIPAEFTSMNQARQYLDIIMKSAMYVSSKFFPLTVNETDFEFTALAKHSPILHPNSQKGSMTDSKEAFNRQVELTSESTEESIQSTSMQIPAREILEKPFTEPQPSELDREILLAKHRQWYSAFRKMPSHLKSQVSANHLLLAVHRKACIHGINSLFLDPQSCDHEKSTLLEILGLCTQFLDEESSLKGGDTNTTYIPDLGVVFPLYFYGIGCRFPSIRARFINLLLRQSRREGVWDSTIAGKVIAWVRDLEERFLEGEGEDKVVPHWARVEDITTTGDLVKKTAKVCCWQREGPGDLVKIRRETFLTW